MNLDNLKPAWRRLQLLNAVRPTDPHEILLILDRAEGMTMNKTNRFVMLIAMVIVLTFCSQGG